MHRYTFVVFLVAFCTTTMVWAEFAEWPIDTNNLSSPVLQQEMRSRLKKYPMTFRHPSQSCLLLRASTKPWLLFKEVGWDFQKSNALSSADFDFDVILFNKQNTNTVYLKFAIEPNSLEACRKAIEQSFLGHISCARSSTWSGSDCLNVPNASFIANFDGSRGNSLGYSILNAYVLIGAIGNRRHLTPNEDLLSIAKSLDTIIYDKPQLPSNYEGSEFRISASATKERKAVLTWEAKGELEDHWIRMDADNGLLSILDDGKVLLQAIPSDGAKVHCYAISPEGVTTSVTTLKIEGVSMKAL